MAYYDEVLKQHTPPKEKPVDKIVAEIEGEFRKVGQWSYEGILELRFTRYLLLVLSSKLICLKDMNRRYKKVMCS